MTHSDAGFSARHRAGDQRAERPAVSRSPWRSPAPKMAEDMVSAARRSQVQQPALGAALQSEVDGSTARFRFVMAGDQVIQAVQQAMRTKGARLRWPVFWVNRLDPPRLSAASRPCAARQTEARHHHDLRPGRGHTRNQARHAVRDRSVQAQPSVSEDSMLRTHEPTIRACENPSVQHARLSGSLRQQRPGAREPVGFFPALRHHQSEHAG